MKRINMFFAIIIVLSLVACNKKPNIELIVGTWEIKEGKFADEDCSKFYFGADKKFKLFDSHNQERESEDQFKYGIINEKDSIDYLNSHKEAENGNFIAIGSFRNKNHFNIVFKIMSLSKDELCLKYLYFREGDTDRSSSLTFKRIKDTE